MIKIVQAAELFLLANNRNDINRPCEKVNHLRTVSKTRGDLIRIRTYC